LGELWLLVEIAHDRPEQPCRSVMTLGYDSAQGRYVGSFVSEMMSCHWVYDGRYDDAADELVLAARGPAFDGSGLANYEDIVAIRDGGWELRSRVETAPGEWREFMKCRYTRG
jgi:hypothetical protein